jgi:hypothetical protein
MSARNDVPMSDQDITMSQRHDGISHDRPIPPVGLAGRLADARASLNRAAPAEVGTSVAAPAQRVATVATSSPSESRGPSCCPRDHQPPANLLDLADRLLHRAALSWSVAGRLVLILLVLFFGVAFLVVLGPQSSWLTTLAAAGGGTGVGAGIGAAGRRYVHRRRRASGSAQRGKSKPKVITDRDPAAGPTGTPTLANE